MAAGLILEGLEGAEKGSPLDHLLANHRALPGEVGMPGEQIGHGNPFFIPLGGKEDGSAGVEDAQLQLVFPPPEGPEEIMKVLGPSLQHEVGDPIRNQGGEDFDLFLFGVEEVLLLIFYEEVGKGGQGEGNDQPHGETYLQEEAAGQEGSTVPFPSSYRGDSFRSKTGKILLGIQNRNRASRARVSFLTTSKAKEKASG
jgi:hypothetical protein